MMTIEQNVNMIAIYGTFLGTFYMVKGFLSLSPIEILKSLPGGGGIAHSLKDITLAVRQRVESRIGIIFVFISVLSQIGIYIQDSSIKEIKLDNKCQAVVVFCTLVLSVASYFFSSWYTKYIVLRVNKLYLIKHLDTKYRDKGMSPQKEDFIRHCAEAYFGIIQGKDESSIDYLNRIYTFVGVKDLYDNSFYNNIIKKNIFLELRDFLNIEKKITGILIIFCSSLLLAVFSIEFINPAPETGLQSYVCIIMGLVLLFYFPLFYKKVIVKNSNIFLRKKRQVFFLQMSLLLVIVTFTLIFWNILLGVNFFVVGIIKLFGISNESTIKKIIEVFGCAVIICYPTGIMVLTMKYYKSELCKYVTNCKFFSAWTGFLAIVISLLDFYWKAYDNMKGIEKLDETQGIWGFGLTILLFRAMVEYYAINDSEKNDVELVTNNKEEINN